MKQFVKLDDHIKSVFHDVCDLTKNKIVNASVVGPISGYRSYFPRATIASRVVYDYFELDLLNSVRSYWPILLAVMTLICFLDQPVSFKLSGVVFFCLLFRCSLHLD